MDKLKTTMTTLWIAEKHGKPFSLCGYTRAYVIAELVNMHLNPVRTWPEIKKEFGLSVSKYKLVRVK